MAKRAAVIIKDRERQYEGLRVSLGLLLSAHEVAMVVLDHEIQVSEEYLDNMEFINEMGGELLSDVAANVEQHGFTHIASGDLADKVMAYDVVIPF